MNIFSVGHDLLPNQSSVGAAVWNACDVEHQIMNNYAIFHANSGKHINSVDGKMIDFQNEIKMVI